MGPYYQNGHQKGKAIEMYQQKYELLQQYQERVRVFSLQLNRMTEIQAARPKQKGQLKYDRI